jgi:hypothetical protein
LRSESAGEIDCIAKIQPYESSNRMVSLDQAYAMMGCTFPPLPRIYTNGIQTCSYMKSLLIIYLIPSVTSSPLCTNIRCWKTKTRPTFRSTSRKCFLSGLQNLVDPPLTPSLRYMCKVTKDFCGLEPSRSSFRPSLLEC